MSFAEQIMSKDKYLSTFLCQMETRVSVYYPSHIFCNTHISLRYFPVLAGRIRSCDVFRSSACEQKIFDGL